MHILTRYAHRMSAIIATLTPQGLVEMPFSGERISEIATQEPAGVYDVTRTYSGGRALLLDSYFDRLERSAQLAGIDKWIDRPATRLAIKRLLAQSGFEEVRLRLTIPRHTPQDLIIALADYAPFHSRLHRIKEHGAIVATLSISRRNPAAKTNDWVQERSDAHAHMAGDVYEGIILDQNNRLLEGFSSNFFAIRNGRLFTADENILPGISRGILLAIAPDVLPVEFIAPEKKQISTFDEAMLTSSGRGVLPIAQNDDHVLGKGVPGPLTSQLMREYDDWVEAHLEVI